MLILEVHPFLVDPPPSWGKLKMRKVVRVLKPKEKLGLYTINEIIFLIVIPVITGNFCKVESPKIIKRLKPPLMLISKIVHFHFRETFEFNTLRSIGNKQAHFTHYYFAP